MPNDEVTGLWGTGSAEAAGQQGQKGQQGQQRQQGHSAVKNSLLSGAGLRGWLNVPLFLLVKGRLPIIGGIAFYYDPY